MSAGPKYEYHWADGQSVKKPIKCSAPKYIDYLMTWVQDQLDDEALFPSKIGMFSPGNLLTALNVVLICRSSFSKKFPHHCQNNFEEVVPSLCTFVSPALLRGDAAGGRGSPQHLFQAFHFLRPGNRINKQNLLLIFLCPKPLVIFQEFSLIDRRELAPLMELIEKLTNKEGRL
jgi:MOB kinase activator 1